MGDHPSGKGGADAYRVQRHMLHIQQCGGVGCMAGTYGLAGLFNLRQRVLEHFQLGNGFGLVVKGAAKMGVCAGEFQIRQVVAGNGLRYLRRQKAVATHAGVDLQMARNLDTQIGSRRLHHLCCPGAADGGNTAGVRNMARLAVHAGGAHH